MCSQRMSHFGYTRQNVKENHRHRYLNDGLLDKTNRITMIMARTLARVGNCTLISLKERVCSEIPVLS